MQVRLTVSDLLNTFKILKSADRAHFIHVQKRVVLAKVAYFYVRTKQVLIRLDGMSNKDVILLTLKLLNIASSCY